MLHILEESAVKKNTKAPEAPGYGVGLDLETALRVEVRVRHLTGPQNAWLDLHVFDEGDQLIRSETLALTCAGAADDGDVFRFDADVYRGTGASPGSVWLAPDARKIQFRLYYEVAGGVFTDGLLHQHDLEPDGALTHCGPPSRPRTALSGPGERDRRAAARKVLHGQPLSTLPTGGVGGRATAGS